MASPCGRSGAPERPARCGDHHTMEEPLKCLTDAYRCFPTGSRPDRSAADVAAVIFGGVCGLERREERCTGAELTCISVTLLEKISSSVTSQSLPVQLTLYFEEILRLLFEDMDLMPHLVHHFRAEDQIISHLAAKCVSACIFFHLHKRGMVCPVWQKKCAQAFHSSCPGTELDACLWSVTDVLRKILKECQQGILGKLLGMFDCSLWALCSKLLPENSEEGAECLDSFTQSRRCGTTLCLLLDLLEVLSASSLICGAPVCLKSQRIPCIRSAALLTTISCSSECFVKKRALLLLKRTVLQKVGEDWALGEALSSGLKYEKLTSDMSMLAQNVLTAVDNNWLHSVQVEPAAFFGGTRPSKMMGDEGQKPDSVMLRAVSLILLKSIELHIQTAGPVGVDGVTEVYGYLQSLWGFLRRHSIQLTEATHLCCWISLLFGEQDDDMMEAAKAALSIFLSHRRRSGLDDGAALEAACASGCNPHCHFVLLLQSISFDHSILLDFLISAETCFLEYFLRYLKYLRDNWQSFTAACGGIGVSGCYSSLQQSLATSSADDGITLTCKGEGGDVGFSSGVQLTGVDPAVNRVSLAAQVRLVEYDSSEESDPDNMEDIEVEPQTSVCEKSRCSASDVQQETSGLPASIRQKQKELPAALLVEPNSTLEREPEGSSPPVLQNDQTSCADMAPLSGQVTSDTLAKTVLCLSELREVVTRLHAKKLFPYNPSSLLKLLAQVDNCHQQSHLLLLSKFTR